MRGLFLIKILYMSGRSMYKRTDGFGKGLLIMDP